MKDARKYIIGMAILILNTSMCMAQQRMDWPKYGNDLANTHFTPAIGNMTTEPGVTWSYAASFSGSPIMADLNNDGNNEVIMPVGSKIEAFTSTGALLWSYATGAGGGIYSSPTVADVNMDGKPDVVFASTDSFLYVINGADASLIWKYKTGPFEYASSPAVADINNDGKPEVIFSSHSGKVFALNFDGSLLWSYQTDGRTYSSPAVGDIDGDGYPEIVVGEIGGTKGTYAFSHEGIVKWTFSTSTNGSPVLMRIPGADKADVVTGAPDSTVDLLDGATGHIKWSYKTGGAYGYSVADMNKDGIPDVVVGTNVAIFVLDGSNGIPIWSTTTGVAGRAPLLADIDGNGSIDIVASISSGGLNCFFNDGIAHFTKGWTKFGSYSFTDPIAGILNKESRTLSIVAGTNAGLYVFGAGSPDSSKGAIKGIVRDSITTSPIEGACIKVGGTLLTAYTNADGYYFIGGVPSGSHGVYASANGYKSKAKGAVVNNDTVEVNFDLVAYHPDSLGSVSGYVFKEGTTVPIAGAEISAFDSGSGQVKVSVRSDSTGAYKIPLVKGGYELVARAFGYLEEWYRESPSRSGDIIVDVAQGQNVTGVFFTLAPLAEGGIAGKVIDTTETGIPFAKVWAQGVSNWVYTETNADSFGAYFIKTIEGVYDVGAFARGYKEGKYPFPVPVLPDSTTSDINITLQSLPDWNGTITGVVKTASDSTPINGAMVIAYGKPSVVPFFGCAFSDSTGAYTIKDVPGGYGAAFYVVAFSRQYVPEYYKDVLSWQTATLVEQNAKDINFFLPKFKKGKDIGGAEGISGRIYNGDNGLADAVIYVKDGENIVASALSLDDGEYVISQLPLGTYTLQVSRIGYNDVTFGPISLMDGSIGNVNIGLVTTGVSENGTSGKKAFSMQIAPSIVKDRAEISYETANNSYTQLSVYDISGRKMVTLVSGKIAAGTHSAILNTKVFPQGVYFIRLVSGNNQTTKKILVLK